MKSIFILAGLAAMTIGSAASASHIANLNTPYSSRGECEAAIADFSSDDRDMLLERFPNFFHNKGDVASFLTRAFSCEWDASSDLWFINDYRTEVFASDWYQRRHD